MVEHNQNKKASFSFHWEFQTQYMPKGKCIFVYSFHYEIDMTPPLHKSGKGYHLSTHKLSTDDNTLNWFISPVELKSSSPYKA